MKKFMERSLTFFTLIILFLAGCINSPDIKISSAESKIDEVVFKNIDIGIDITNSEKDRLKRLIKKTLSYNNLNKTERDFLNNYLPILDDRLKKKVILALGHIEKFEKQDPLTYNFSTGEKNKDLLIKLALKTNLNFDLTFNQSGIYIDNDLINKATYNFCDSYSNEQRKFVESVVFADGIKMQKRTHVIFGKDYNDYIAYLKNLYPLASYSEVDPENYDEFISIILGISESNMRMLNIQKLDLNIDIQFLPRKKADIKKIYLVMDYEDAKSLVPTLKNYVMDFPIFGTADLLYGITEPKKILDYEGIFLPFNKSNLDSLISKQIDKEYLKEVFDESILNELLIQQNLTSSGIRRATVESDLSQINFNLNGCNSRIFSIAVVGEN